MKKFSMKIYGIRRLFLTAAIFLLAGVFLLGCLGGRADAPRDTIEISKHLKKNETTAVDTLLIDRRAVEVYAAIENVFKRLNIKQTIIHYKYNTITQQYDTVSPVTLLYGPIPKTLKGALVSSERGKDRKRLLMVYVDPTALEGTLIKTARYSYNKKKQRNPEPQELLQLIAAELGVTETVEVQ